MVTMAKEGLSHLLLNLRKMLNHRFTVLCITAILAFYVLWQAGALVWKMWLFNDQTSQARAIGSSSPKNTEPESLQNLLRYPLIQSASIKAKQDVASIDAPETSLNLKLAGLMYSTDQSEARAIIVSQEDGARSYAAHERVAGKAEVYSIEPDRVILLRAGRREALLLSPEQNTAAIRPETQNQAQGAAKQDQAPGQDSKGAPKNTDDLMRDFSATPVMENGKLMGFHITAVRNPQLMNEWGIGPDDVITAVNGTPLNSPGRIMILYDKLKKQKEFELTLNNGGNSRIITVDANE